MDGRREEAEGEDERKGAGGGRVEVDFILTIEKVLS